MAQAHHDGRHPPFPFPIPEATRVKPLSMPFPPPPLPPPDETVHVLARRVAGIPLPLFFAIGAVVGIILASTVVSILRHSTHAKDATRAKVVSAVSTPAVEAAHALFVWTPPSAEQRASDAPIELDVIIAGESSPDAQPAASPVMRAALAMNRAPALQAKAHAHEKRGGALPNDLLSAGL